MQAHAAIVQHKQRFFTAIFTPPSRRNRDKRIIVFLSIGRYNGQREILRGPARKAKKNSTEIRP